MFNVKHWLVHQDAIVDQDFTGILKTNVFRLLYAVLSYFENCMKKIMNGFKTNYHILDCPYNEQLNLCSQSCPPRTCRAIGQRIKCPSKHPLLYRCKPACDCKFNFRRNDDGHCVQIERCRKFVNVFFKSKYTYEYLLKNHQFSTPRMRKQRNLRILSKTMLRR